MGFDVKITTKISILDLIAPFSCKGCGRLGEVLCERCKNYIKQGGVKGGRDDVFAVGYREGILLEMVEEYKYKSIRKMAKVLAELMDDALPEDLGEEVVIVPLPTINRHIRERGFDHTMRLAKELAKRRGWEVLPALARRNKTVQVGADEKTRIKQAKEAYEVSSGVEVSGEKVYLLLDDVYTTGASMRAAEEVMKKAGVRKVRKVVVARGR